VFVPTDVLLKALAPVYEYPEYAPIDVVFFPFVASVPTPKLVLFDAM
jgi:hypothetical protein